MSTTMIIRVHDDGTMNKLRLSEPRSISGSQSISDSISIPDPQSTPNLRFIPNPKFKMFSGAFTRFQPAPPPSISMTPTHSREASTDESIGKIDIPNAFRPQKNELETAADLNPSLDVGRVDVAMFDMRLREQQRITQLIAVADEKCHIFDAHQLSAKQRTWPPDPTIADDIEEIQESEDTAEQIKYSPLSEQLWMISGLYYRHNRSPPASPSEGTSVTSTDEVQQPWYKVNWF